MSFTFAAVGAAHPHVHIQIEALMAAGARLKWFYDDDPAIRKAFATRYDDVAIAPELDTILDDPEVLLVVSTVAHDERAALGIAVMQHGKDYLCAKPGFTSIEQLEAARRVQVVTGQRYLVFFSERLASRSTHKALELVQAGRIGPIIQVVGFGPHRLMGSEPRPAWWYQRSRYGGILNDLASHQIDQFLIFTDSAKTEIVSAQVGCAKFQQFQDFDDFGEVQLRSEFATGTIRVDWLTPNGLPTWGDVRLFLLGRDGTIELRKNIDISGRAGTDHLLVIDHAGIERVPCHDVELPFTRQLISDIYARSETAMSQAHCFTVCELALQAQAQAIQLTFRTNHG